MTSSDQQGSARVAYRVRARNTHTDSENRIHDDETAARFGFLGGLVPGVTVFAYMTVPVVERFSREWLDHGRISVRFHQPFYDGDEVIIRTEDEPGASPVRMKVTAERAGVVSAVAVAFLEDTRGREPRIEDYPRAQLPDLEARPAPSRETLAPGSVLGTFTEQLDARDTAFLESVSERLPVYSGPDTIAHPAYLLGLANQIFVRNFKLGPWIHAASEVISFSAARRGEQIEARGRIGELFERKGHEFVTLDLLLTVADRIIQQVRHTAIYRIAGR